VRAIRSLNLDFVRITSDLEELASQPIVFLGREWELSSVYQQLSQALQSFLSAIAAGTVDVVVGFASTLFWLVFILLAAFYLVKDADRITGWLDDLPPSSMQEDAIRLRRRITNVWNAFLRGQILMAFFLAVITTIVATIVGLPNPLALGLLAGAMEFVPNLGPIIAAVPAVLLAFFQGSSWVPLSNFWFAVLVLGLYLIIQQIEGNVLLPRILGQSLNLHPLIVLVAVIAGGSLAGILGVLLAAPVVATMRVLADYLYKRLTDQDPFPEEEPAESKSWFGLILWQRVRRRLLSGQWVVRPAQAEDWPDVEQVCSKIWDGEDYVPQMWAEWLEDPRGELTVVERKGRVMALAKLTRLADDEWWLEGLRVDPRYRRLGVARLLQTRQLAVLDGEGEGVVRFATGSHNRAIHQNASRDAFQRVAKFLYYGADPLPGLCPIRKLSTRNVKAAWKLVERSPVLEAASGLYEVSWQWLRLTRERFVAHLRAGEVWASDVNDRMAAVAIVPQWEREEPSRLTVGYLSGEAEGIIALAWGLRVLAGQEGREGVRIRPPDYAPLLESLEAAGVRSDWEHDLWVFERSVYAETEDEQDG
jgi:predicted PurR-regulated permease PerM